jgi:acetate kinase
MSNILVINAGSSSLKFAVFDEDLKLLHKSQVDTPDTRRVVQALADAGFAILTFTGIGHRLVHGGTKFITPLRIEDGVYAELKTLCHLAPLHLPIGLELIENLRALAPDVPNIACFDTAFHATQPDVAKRLPLLRDFHTRGYQRYGFHGLNYEHVVQAIEPLPKRLLIAHLGNGASMCAVLNGKSVATTMGYSTADGLVMGTRTGSIDPGVLLALMRDDGLDANGLEDLLYRRSGLLGVSGVSSDMRELLASKEPAAAEAVDFFCYHAARHAGSLAVAVGGVDAIAFTGGVGENADVVRNKIMAHLDWLKIGNVRVVPANEELTIARHVKRLLTQ